MPVTLEDDPIADMLAEINRLFPYLDAEIVFCGDLQSGGECAIEMRPVQIAINPTIPYTSVLEVLAHEVAHAVVGQEGDRFDSDEHGPRWQQVFAQINQAYDDAMVAKFGAENIVSVPDPRIKRRRSLLSRLRALWASVVHQKSPDAAN